MTDQAQEVRTDPILAFAQVALGDMAIGIDARHVVRALARPSALARLPRSHGAIDGVFKDGAHVIPVVDLHKWMGEPAQTPPSRVLVLGAQGRMVGLAIDAVRGLVRARQSQLRRVHHRQVEDDFFHSVAPAGDGSLLSVLDPLRLIERVGVWTDSFEGDAGGGAPAPENSGSAAPVHAQALVRVGATVLALPAVLVAQVLKRPKAQPLLGAACELLGMIRWRGRHVPLVDIGAMLGLETGPAPLVAIVAQDDMLVALPVDEIIAVRPLPPASAAKADEAGACHPLVQAITLLGEEGRQQRVLQIDAGILLRTHAAPGLSRQDEADAGASSARAAQRAAAHVIFDAGRRWAVPMAALEAILPLPESDAANADPMPTFAWRGRSLPLLDIREGGEASLSRQGPQRVLVVQHGGRHAALRVHDVVELLAAQSGELLQFPTAGGMRVRMITVGEGAGRISYPVLDLDTLPFFARS